MVDEEVEEVTEEIEEEVVETAVEERNADANDGDRLGLQCSPLAMKVQKSIPGQPSFSVLSAVVYIRTLLFNSGTSYIPFSFRAVIPSARNP